MVSKEKFLGMGIFNSVSKVKNKKLSSKEWPPKNNSSPTLVKGITTTQPILLNQKISHVVNTVKGVSKCL